MHRYAQGHRRIGSFYISAAAPHLAQSRRTPLERLAHFLLEVHSRLLAVGLAQETSFDLPFSQKILADVLGLSFPHLNRVMQQLRVDKLIESHPRRVNLVDVPGLRKLAHYHPFNLGSIPLPAGSA